jgi:hypothetical protein
MKRVVAIDVSLEKAKDALEQFFALDFQDGRDCDLHYYDDGVEAKEVFRTSPVALVLHIALTLFTVGLWLVVWVLMELVQRGQIQSVRVQLVDNNGPAAKISGSDAWVQTTEAFIRRNLRAPLN